MFIHVWCKKPFGLISQSPTVPIERIKNFAIADGLKWIDGTFPGNNYDCPNAGLPGGQLVYFAIWPGVDYHWWRLDVASVMQSFRSTSSTYIFHFAFFT